MLVDVGMRVIICLMVGVGPTPPRHSRAAITDVDFLFFLNFCLTTISTKLHLFLFNSTIYLFLKSVKELQWEPTSL